jgi:hypothetical protein
MKRLVEVRNKEREHEQRGMEDGALLKAVRHDLGLESTIDLFPRLDSSVNATGFHVEWRRCTEGQTLSRH